MPGELSLIDPIGNLDEVRVIHLSGLLYVMFRFFNNGLFSRLRTPIPELE